MYVQKNWLTGLILQSSTARMKLFAKFSLVARCNITCLPIQKVPSFSQLLFVSWTVKEYFQQWEGGSVLELGAGCGMIGLFLAKFCPPEELAGVILTDYLPALVENLEHNYALNESNLNHTVTANFLDWASAVETDEGYLPSLRILDGVTLLVGSELVYGPSQVCLADILRLFFKQDTINKKKKEAWIIQTLGRPGWDEMVARLGTFGVRFELLSVEDLVWEATLRAMEEEGGRSTYLPRAGCSDFVLLHCW